MNRPMLALTGIVFLAACTTAHVEYDRMTGTAFPQETVVDGETVTLGTIYLQGNILLGVVEDETAIAALTGPPDPADPNQYDYITDAEVETLEAAHRGIPVGMSQWTCRLWVFSGTCRRYHIWGIVVNHYRETPTGVRETGTLGRMTDPDLRSTFASYWRNSTVNSDNAKYLRSTAHEIGHGFNLNHCDGDGSSTIMNQTGTVGDSYTFTFSSASLDHLQNHDRAAVWPGLGPRHYECPHILH